MYVCMYVRTYVCIYVAMLYVCMYVLYICMYVCMYVCTRDLQYISIRQYIDTLIEYRIVILCSMNIEISDGAECMFHVVNITFLCVKS